MNIQLFSDLHLEFWEFEIRCEQADVLVFAGDIHIGVKGIQWLASLNINKPVIYVLGNHEYYRNTYPSLIAKVKQERAGSHIHVLENDSVSIDGITFHGCTLWTDFELMGNPRVAGYECQQVMTDFKKIRRYPGYSKLRAVDVAQIHKQSRNWLADSLQRTTGPNVVISHHAPSLKSAPEKHKNNIIASAYASNMEDFILEHQPDLWLHGHMHNSSDYRIGNCRVVCNPRGYLGESNDGFESEKLIELPQALE